MLHGIATVEQNQPEQGLILIREGISTCKKLGTVSGLSGPLTGLAQSYKSAGNIQQASEALDQAFEFAKTHDEHAWEAELYRIKGELLLDQRLANRRATRSRSEQEAEECFRAAMELARNQGAQKWNLRAATSLCMLRRQQNTNLREALELLASACNAVSESENNLDLNYAQLVLSGVPATN